MGHAEVFYWTLSGVSVHCMWLWTLCCGCIWILSLHTVLASGNFLTDILPLVLCNMFCHLCCMSGYFAEPCTYCCLQVTQSTKLVLYLQVTGSMRRTGMLSITGCQYFRVAEQTATYCSKWTCKICCIWDWALQIQWNRWFWITQIYVKTYLNDS